LLQKNIKFTFIEDLYLLKSKFAQKLTLKNNVYHLKYNQEPLFKIVNQVQIKHKHHSSFLALSKAYSFLLKNT